MKYGTDISGRSTQSHDKCPNCGWSLSSGGQDPREQSSTFAAANKDPLLVDLTSNIEFLSVPPPKQDHSEKRRHKRLKTDKIKGCIRVGDSLDVVDVLDISRRGVRFSSSRLYMPNTAVEVSAPFTIDGNNIFSAGKILRAHRRPTKLLPGIYALEILF